MKALHLLVSEKKNFEVCLSGFVPVFKLVTPGAGQFDPWGIICTNLVEVHREMLNTKYQNSTASSFRENEF